MEIAVIGGSFNPPTRAHEAIIAACLNEKEFDEVWVMPSGDRWDKQYQVSSADRLKMLELIKEEVFDDDNRLIVSDFELSMPRPTQTWRTVQALRNLHHNADFRFVYGADVYSSMPLWEHGAELQTELPMLLVNRDGQAVPAAANIKTLTVDIENDVSSTRVRECVAAGMPISKWVCRSVERYIMKKQLYQTTQPCNVTKVGR